MKVRFKVALLLLFSLLFTPLVSSCKRPEPGEGEKLVVYSARKEHLIKPVLEAFTKETGIEVQYHTDKAGQLLQKLKAEKKRPQADVLITVDAGNLWHAAKEGLLQSVDSKTLKKNIPKHLRDPKNRWFAFSLRARTMVYRKDLVDPANLSTYAALADSRWKGRLCLRTSKKVYNQSLVAMLIEEHGKEKAEKIVKGWVENLATKPFSSDTEVIKHIGAESEKGLVGIVNSYYYGRLVKKDPSFKEKVGIFWANQEDSGVHVNVSGGGLVKGAPRGKKAKKLLEWLSSKKAQKLFSDLNLEFPVHSEVEPHSIVKEWGDFKANRSPIYKAGELQSEAIKLMDRAGYK